MVRDLDEQLKELIESGKGIEREIEELRRNKELHQQEIKDSESIF